MTAPLPVRAPIDRGEHTSRLPARTGLLARLLDIGKVSVLVGTNQVLIQAIGLASGLLIIRLLPTREYALYTLGSAAVSTALLLADSGIASGVMAEGGKVLREAQALANVVATGIALRRKFSLWSAIVCVPPLVWLLRRHGADWANCTLIALAVLSAFLTSLTGAILEIPLKLRQDLGRLQRVQLKSTLLRFGTVVALVPFARWAVVALAANGFAQAWLNRRLRGMSREDPVGIPVERTRGALIKIVRLTLPGVVYYCLCGQLSVWLLSLFGTTAAVAQIGALNRLAAALTIVSSCIGLVAVPRFARLPNRRRLLYSRYGLVLACVVGLSTAICTLVWRFPDTALAVLGPRYRGLHTEALLMATASCLGLIAATMNTLAAGRGLVLRPEVGIPVGIATTIGAILVSDVSTTLGVLKMSVLLAGFGALFTVATGAWLIERHSA